MERGDRERGQSWKLSLPEIIRWQIDRAVANAVAPYSGGGDMITREEADRRRAVAIARIAEIDLDEKVRSVVHVADAKDMMSDFAQAVRQGGDNAFSKIAGRAAQMNSPHEILEMCRKEWNRGMQVAREELTRRWRDVLDGKPIGPDSSSDLDAPDDTNDEIADDFDGE